MPNPKFNKNYHKFYQHSGGVPPSLPPHLAGNADDQDAPHPTYPGSGYAGPPHRFNPNYHYMKFEQYHQYPSNNPHYNPHYNKQYPGSKGGKESGDKEKHSGSDNETGNSGNEGAVGGASSDIEIDSELTTAVAEITSAIAAASASGKELTLTQEQQLTLQKHQLLVQQQQQLKQQKAQQIQMTQLQMQQANQASALKKFPNYRLLGRNIFDGGVKQPFFQKKKINKANTYYSRFIKQHPTMNLPLAFQKSVSLAEDKAQEERDKPPYTESVFASSLQAEANIRKEKKKLTKRSKKKTKKRLNNESNSDSDASSSSTSSKASSKSSGSINSSTSGEIKTTKKIKEVSHDYLFLMFIFILLKTR